VNNLKWNDLNKEEYQTVYNYYKGLIAFRKEHPALRMTSADEVSQKITELSDLEFSVTGFHIAPGANGEANELVVIFNPRADATTVTLPEGVWTVYINGEDAGTEPLGNAEGTVEVAAISACVLVQEPAPALPETVSPTESTLEPHPQNRDSFDSTSLILLCTLCACILCATGLYLGRKEKH
jgi:pullulanase